MADSQKNSNVVDLLPKIVDLDELLRFVCGASNEDVCMHGLSVSLLQAKGLSGDLRAHLEQLAAEQAIEIEQHNLRWNDKNSVLKFVCSLMGSRILRGESGWIAAFAYRKDNLAYGR